MIVDKLGTRPAPSKIDAITQLSRPNTVEEVRVLLGMTGYFFLTAYDNSYPSIAQLWRPFPTCCEIQGSEPRERRKRKFRGEKSRTRLLMRLSRL